MTVYGQGINYQMGWMIEASISGAKDLAKNNISRAFRQHFKFPWPWPLPQERCIAVETQNIVPWTTSIPRALCTPVPEIHGNAELTAAVHGIILFA